MCATSHFASKDPFRQQLGVSTASSAPALTPSVPPKVVKSQPSTKPTVPGKGVKPLAEVGSGTIVIVASIPVAQGLAAANKAASQARTKGVPNVHVALSLAHSKSGSGFYAVYSGTYGSRGKALKALQHIRSLGYASAYTRHLTHL